MATPTAMMPWDAVRLGWRPSMLLDTADVAGVVREWMSSGNVSGDVALVSMPSSEDETGGEWQSVRPRGRRRRERASQPPPGETTPTLLANIPRLRFCLSSESTTPVFIDATQSHALDVLPTPPVSVLSARDDVLAALDLGAATTSAIVLPPSALGAGPALLGWMLGYPVVYHVDVAETMHNNLSLEPLCLFHVFARSSRAPQPSEDASPLTTFSIPEALLPNVRIQTALRAFPDSHPLLRLTQDSNGPVSLTSITM